MPQAIVAFAFGSAFAATTAGTLVAGAIGIGLSIGANLLVNALFGPKQPRPEDVQGIFRQSVAPRMRHYGRVRVGGNVVFIETKNGALYQLIVHGQGPITGYHETYLDNRLVALEAGYAGGVTTAPYNPAFQIIDSQFGWPGDSGWGRLNTDFPTIWGTDRKLEGVAASLLYTATVDQEDVTDVYPNRIAILHRVIDGVACFDPRGATTTAFTRNPALILRDYLTHPDGMGLPGWLIDDDMIGSAASICDEAVSLKAGGTIPRYQIGLSYDFETEPKGVLNRIIAASDGRLVVTSEGKIGFTVGKWVEPTVTIDDDAGHIIDYEMTDGVGPFTQSNEIIVKYTQVETGYKEATADPWRDEDSISQLGEVRSNLLTAYEIQHHNHARRIAKIVQARAAPRWQGSIVTTLHGLNAWDQRWINLKIPEMDIDGTFEIISPPAVDVTTMTITMEVQSFDPATYDFDPATEEGTAPAVPDDAPDTSGLPEPTSVTTGSLTKLLSQVNFDNTIGAWDPDTESNDYSNDPQSQNVEVYFAFIQWAAPDRAGLSPEVQFSTDGGTNWQTVAASAGVTRSEVGPMPRPSTVLLRVRFKAVVQASDWVVGDPVSIPAI